MVVVAVVLPRVVMPDNAAAVLAGKKKKLSLQLIIIQFI